MLTLKLQKHLQYCPTFCVGLHVALTEPWLEYPLQVVRQKPHCP
jgi:hypothetical protein